MLAVLARPWTTDRAERRRAGPGQWWGFPVGGAARCPVCATVLAEYGAGLEVAVRVHPNPGAHRTRPTERLGEARACSGCRQWMDLALGVIDRVASPI